MDTRRTWNIPKVVVFVVHNAFAIAFTVILWQWGLSQLALTGVLFALLMMVLTVAVWLPVIGSIVIAFIAFTHVPALQFNGELLAFLPTVIMVLIGAMYPNRLTD
ncbi:hypothetical protein VTH8203_01529 [Vibrio thalassae]|uniref:Uncharacterized protein n=1 Tax=Vibrio thalassae TaxID=1243014 RepID=A0A240EGX3_9VIBR|nr:hypothetical protein [Vibrio thalassae]SNX47914.1 hypothetical protein VTH8203_01529 [Vibrio thalassae]